MARHVFFSYAHADAGRLLPFYNTLQEQARPRRHLIWIDRGLVGGDLWENRIRLAINNSYAVIFAVTKTFIERPFIREKEIPWTFDRFPATLDDTERLPIFPVLFDPLPSDWDKAHASLKRLAEVQYLDGVGHDTELVVQDLLKIIPTPPANTNFIVTWPRLPNFKGRKESLDQLHNSLQAEGSKAGITTVAALHGTGGVGKTQLAVEYAHQYQPEYPGGVFWINAAQDWRKELAELAERLNLKPADPNDTEREKQLVLAFREYLRQQQSNREAALIVLDNIERPESIKELLIGPKQLTIQALCEETGVRLLLTTRVVDLPDGCTARLVDVLLPNDALEVLLDAWIGSETARQDTPDHKALEEIARGVGYLPLALGWMVAALRAMPDLAPTDLLAELRASGIDEVVETLQEQDVKLGTPSYYESLVGKALAWQLAQIKDEEPKRLLALLAAYAEAAVIPRERLRLLSGLPESGLKRHFTHAIKALQKFSLVEMLNDGATFRLHPLTRDYAQRKLAATALITTAAQQLISAYHSPAILDEQIRTRGYFAVYDDLAHTQAVLAVPNPDIKQMERLLRLEEHSLLRLPADAPPGYVIQQVRDSAHHEGDTRLCFICDSWLQDHAHFVSSPESLYAASSALLKTLHGHQGIVRGAVELRDGRLLSWADDNTLRLWSSEGHELAVLHGYLGYIRGAVELHDGRLLSWSGDSTLRLWSSEGHELTVLHGHKEGVSGAVELRDGRLLSWADDGTLRLWSSEGHELAVLHGYLGYICGAVELRDGRLLSWTNDNTLRLWSSEGHELAVLHGHMPSVLGILGVNGAVELRDGRLLSWADDNTLRLWSSEGHELAVLHGHQEYIRGAVELHDGRLLSWADDGTLRLWSSEGHELAVLHGYPGSMSGAVELRDGRLLSWAGDSTLRLWSSEGDKLAVLHGHMPSVLGVLGVNGAVELRDGRLLSWAGDNTLRLWSSKGLGLAVLRGHITSVLGILGAVELRDGRLLSWAGDSTLRLWSSDESQLAGLQGHDGGVSGAVELRDGRLLSWAGDSTLRLWSSEGHELAVLHGHMPSMMGVNGAVELRDGRLLSWAGDSTLRLWSSEGHELAVLHGHKGYMYGAVELRDGRLLSWSSDRTLRLWSSEGHELAVLHGHKGYMRGAVELRDGRLLSWAGDSTLRLWSSEGHELAVLHGHQHEVHDAVELHDGRLLSWAGDSTLRLWSSEGHELTILRGHEEGVSGAVELRDGRLLSWSGDSTLRLWSSEGHKLTILHGHERGVLGVRGAVELRDGRLLSWAADGTLRLWSSEGHELAILHGHERGVLGVHYAMVLDNGRFLSWADDGTLRLWSAQKTILGIYSNDAAITLCQKLKTGKFAIGDAAGRVIVLAWNEGVKILS